MELFFQYSVSIFSFLLFTKLDTVFRCFAAFVHSMLEWDETAKAGKLLHIPAREDIPENIKEQLIVELYSK